MGFERIHSIQELSMSMELQRNMELPRRMELSGDELSDGHGCNYNKVCDSYCQGDMYSDKIFAKKENIMKENRNLQQDLIDLKNKYDQCKLEEKELLKLRTKV